MTETRIKRAETVFDWFVEYIPFIVTGITFLGCLGLELTQTFFSSETRGRLYSIIGTFFHVYSILLCFLYGRKFRMDWITAFVCAFASLDVVFGTVSGLWRKLELFLFESGGYAAFRAAIFLLPMCWLLSLVYEKRTLQLCDYMTPFFFYKHGSVTTACWIAGCCAGKECSWGLFNPDLEAVLFPTQPVIILLSTGVAFWGILYSRNHDYKGDGRVFAYSLIAYGVGRFLLEFVSDDIRVVGPLSLNSLICLAMIAVGGLLIRGIRKQPKSIST